MSTIGLVAGTLVSAEGELLYTPAVDLLEGLGHRVGLVFLPQRGLGRPHDAAVFLERMWQRQKLGEPDIVIGHSQGGVWAWAYANEHVRTVHELCLLAAPVHGTIWAPTWAPWAGIRAMSRPSRHLRAVRHGDFPRTRIVSVFTTVDLFVVPMTSSFVRDARNYLIGPRLGYQLLRLLVPGIVAGITWLPGLAEHVALASNPAMLSCLRALHELPTAV